MKPIRRFGVLQAAPAADVHVLPAPMLVAMLYVREAMPWLIQQAVRDETG